MCHYIDSNFIMPGWGCCACAAKSPEGAAVYNGMQRTACKQCDRYRCVPLSPDKQTGTTFETRIHHR